MVVFVNGGELIARDDRNGVLVRVDDVDCGILGHITDAVAFGILERILACDKGDVGVSIIGGGGAGNDGGAAGDKACNAGEGIDFAILIKAKVNEVVLNGDSGAHKAHFTVVEAIFIGPAVFHAEDAVHNGVIIQRELQGLDGAVREGTGDGEGGESAQPVGRLGNAGYEHGLGSLGGLCDLGAIDVAVRVEVEVIGIAHCKGGDFTGDGVRNGAVQGRVQCDGGDVVHLCAGKPEARAAHGGQGNALKHLGLRNGVHGLDFAVHNTLAGSYENVVTLRSTLIEADNDVAVAVLHGGDAGDNRGEHDFSGLSVKEGDLGRDGLKHIDCIGLLVAVLVNDAESLGRTGLKESGIQCDFRAVRQGDTLVKRGVINGDLTARSRENDLGVSGGGFDCAGAKLVDLILRGGLEVDDGVVRGQAVGLLVLVPDRKVGANQLIDIAAVGEGKSVNQDLAILSQVVGIQRIVRSGFENRTTLDDSENFLGRGVDGGGGSACHREAGSFGKHAILAHLGNGAALCGSVEGDTLKIVKEAEGLCLVDETVGECHGARVVSDSNDEHLGGLSKRNIAGRCKVAVRVADDDAQALGPVDVSGGPAVGRNIREGRNTLVHTGIVRAGHEHVQNFYELFTSDVLIGAEGAVRIAIQHFERSQQADCFVVVRSCLHIIKGECRKHTAGDGSRDNE
ncbi:hypothetical protein SDC9_77083 [bioreactor metagenome]|uniref:Uncharacterized protein n=1 Tax=bioreactor metagenome TaxID=1076179 RepID=A0A644YVP4_9ZZZZ